MKGSTLHRSGLTREKMGLLASLSHTDKKQATRAQLNQYYKTAKTQELDLLWGGVQKGIQKVHSATKGTIQKSPASYFTIGFISGVVFMCCILLIVSISTIAPKAVNTEAKAPVAVIGTEAPSPKAEPVVTNEKYIIKKGDTINGIAYRFYGRYNEAKIQEIMRINGITDPTSMRIGQELMIPVSQDR